VSRAIMPELYPHLFGAERRDPAPAHEVRQPPRDDAAWIRQMVERPRAAPTLEARVAQLEWQVKSLAARVEQLESQ
jgi:uncharacterized protein YceH (UPF0502 family)